jgi:hypothetical protein
MESRSYLESVSPLSQPGVRLFVALTVAEAAALATLKPDPVEGTDVVAALRGLAKIRTALEAQA